MQSLRALIEATGGAGWWSLGLLALGCLSLAAALAAGALWRGRAMVLPFAIMVAVFGAGCLVARELLAHKVGVERTRTLEAMALRPWDPWPRGEGHVPLGLVGAALAHKGYAEPGGEFSPGPGSFGVSIWVFDGDGRRVATSGDIPLAQTWQQYGPGGASLDFRTPYYRGAWSAAAPAGFRLQLSVERPYRVELALRSVGPAGGALHRIERVSAGVLRLDGRWLISSSADLEVTFLGREGLAWTRVSGARVEDRRGWAAARMRAPRQIGLQIADLHAPRPVGDATRAAEALGLPGIDPRFDASLIAQMRMLAQAQLGGELVPGDPINYPDPWLRDAAYILVALARAGQTERLRELAEPIAARDYFGGFGSEADAPGLALWALGEVSAALSDEEFDSRVWPHVVRKSEIIERLLTARADIRSPFHGRAVPAHRGHPDLDLVAEAARNGLIFGRMDWHRPVFYVNGVSYLGLVHASELARSLGHAEEAQRWDRTAEEIRERWRAAFLNPRMDGDRRNDRTAIVGLWPADIADPLPYSQLLEERWVERRFGGSGGFKQRPLWTYFDLAEAHQWLRLGRPERAWQTLEWFWDRQPAPGLFALWEGDAEENSARLWQQTRGWVQPKGVTPHFWSSAEMLLLQLAMLVEVEGSPVSGTLVIGPGVPRSWLARPFRVGPIGTAAGPVEWSWTGSQVTVSAPAELPVRLGPAFPTGTPITVSVRPGSR